MPLPLGDAANRGFKFEPKFCMEGYWTRRKGSEVNPSVSGFRWERQALDVVNFA